MNEQKYKIKEKFMTHISKFPLVTPLDIKGKYTKEVWNKHGFKDGLLEKC